MRESAIGKRIMVLLSQKYGVCIFSNPVGTGWVGRFVRRMGEITFLEAARRIKYGLHEGMPDKIGWRSIKITPEMVGRRVAVLVAIEVKQPGNYASPIQKQILKRLQDDGALSGIARSEQDAVAIVTKLEAQ